MMARPIIQATLALVLLLNLVYIQSKGSGGVQADQLIKLKTTQEENVPSGPQQSKWRMSREAGRKNAKGRQNKKTTNKKSKKEGKTNKIRRKNRQSKKMEKQRQIKSRKTKTNGRKPKKENKKRKRKSRKHKRKSRKNRNKSRKNRKMKRQGKKETKKTKERSKKAKKVFKKGTRKSSQHKTKTNEISRQKARQACDENALGQKLKDYIKISNQLRKVRRIKKACDLMEKKANKSLTAFEATVTALESSLGSISERRMYVSRSRWKRSNSSNEEYTKIKEQLKNCSKTASAKCKKSSVEACQNETLLTTCETKLQDWIDKFGPAAGSCLKAPDKYCACITALPDVPKDCVAFDQKNTMALNSKKKCTSGDEEGSFGFCKKLIGIAAGIKPGAGQSQIQATECLDEPIVQGIVTTRSSAIRRRKARETRNTVCACFNSDCILNEYTWLTSIPTLAKQFYISFSFFADKIYKRWQNIIDLTFGTSCGGRGTVYNLMAIYSDTTIEFCFPDIGNFWSSCIYIYHESFEIKKWYDVTIKQDSGGFMFHATVKKTEDGSTIVVAARPNTAPSIHNSALLWGTHGPNLVGKIANLTVNPLAPTAPTTPC